MASKKVVRDALKKHEGTIVQLSLQIIRHDVDLGEITAFVKEVGSNRAVFVIEDEEKYFMYSHIQTSFYIDEDGIIKFPYKHPDYQNVTAKLSAIP